MEDTTVRTLWESGTTGRVVILSMDQSDDIRGNIQRLVALNFATQRSASDASNRVRWH